MTEANGKRVQLHKLSRPEAFRLSRWLDASWDRMKVLTREKAAALASAELQLTLNAALIVRVIRDMGREFPGVITVARKLKGVRFGRNQQILAQQTRAVARELVRLAGLLGERVGADSGIDFGVLDALSRNHRPDVAEPTPTDAKGTTNG